jgi:hypothetical protein
MKREYILAVVAGTLLLLVGSQPVVECVRLSPALGLNSASTLDEAVTTVDSATSLPREVGRALNGAMASTAGEEVEDRHRWKQFGSITVQLALGPIRHLKTCI